MLVPVTAFYAALLCLCYLYLSMLVIAYRRQHKVSLGYGEDKHLEQVIRCHGNFAEYVPITLFLLLVAELNKGAPVFLHLAGASLLFGRVLHAYGLRHHHGASWQRVWGTLLTFFAMLGLSALVLIEFYL
ncbi:MAPEG family protein [Aestuariibacter salexigens]|uniref:MAPEG family protein n=1 Tax=Aestuariibacter salexigens TaxID=226010 RepID=UPI000478C20F|nr:MAPEG family protein [Aestuariibacter salexigens]